MLRRLLTADRRWLTANTLCPLRLEHRDALVRAGVPGDFLARAVEVHLVVDEQPGRLVPNDLVDLVEIALELLLVQLNLERVECLGILRRVRPVRKVETVLLVE